MKDDEMAVASMIGCVMAMSTFNRVMLINSRHVVTSKCIIPELSKNYTCFKFNTKIIIILRVFVDKINDHI